MPTLEKYLGKVYIWHYVPNLPAAIAFAAIFSVATLAHTWKMLRTRTWICLPFVVGGICTSSSTPHHQPSQFSLIQCRAAQLTPPVEVIGFLGRIFAHFSTGDLGAFIVQAVFLLLPPVLFAASLYMVYSRVVRAVRGERFSAISPRWTTRVFVFGDLMCLNIQSAGAGLTPHAKIARIEDGIIVAGLGLQVLMFAVFVVYCLKFHRRFLMHVKETGVVVDAPWEQCLNMLYATSLLIQVRNVFRMVEYIMGSDGYLFSNEWPTYALDAVLMFLVMVAFFVFYPSQLGVGKGGQMVELNSDVASDRELVSRPAACSSRT
jgi:hypothetical protein